ncbi:hypothetical protein BJV82DRAFT_595768 [Fennellomyces sp. T-0311]|nr:hypothetical protein BJV82DRAFT_595768 [Fennellomyces sp. T-0311]
MNPTLVQKIFGHSEEVQIEAPPISVNRLENAFSGLHNFVPGAENLRKTTKALKRSGMDILQSTALTRLLSGDSDHTIFLRTAPPTKAKGLMLLIAIAHQKDLRVFYFSTRKHAQVINPIGKTTVSVLQHTDSYLGEKTKWFQLCDLPEYKVLPETRSSASLRPGSGGSIVKRLKRHLKGRKASKKLKNVPRIYDEIQASILKRHPMDMAPNWFADRIKGYKDYDRFQYFKSEGYRLHEEVQGFLDSCTWDEVMGYQDSDQEANNSDDQETDDEGSQAVKNKDTSMRETATFTETMTFSLRSILREEIAYDGFLNRLENEKLRVGRCMAQLSNGVSALTDMIASGRMARLCGTVVDDTIFDIQALVPGFDFGPEAKTSVHVSPIPPDLDKLEDARVYQFEHFSNILSGTSSQCTLSVSIN